MKATLGQSMDWLHTWAGLLLGWVLYFMFVTGTLAYLDTEIDRWMMPELPMAAAPGNAALALEHATDALKADAPGAINWRIRLPVDRNQPYTTVRWRGAQDGTKAQSGKLRLDPVTGNALSVRETGGGQALYRMHWQLHYLPRLVGEWIVGIASLCMFVALLTGVVIHRKLFADFFTFRAGKGQRSWLDAHNLTSVVSLPFQLMITYSGLLFLMFTYLPLMIAVWYGPGQEGRQVFFDEAFPRPAALEASAERAPLVALSSVYTTAQSSLDDDDKEVVSLAVQNPGAAQRSNHGSRQRSAAPVAKASGSGLRWRYGRTAAERSPLPSQAARRHGISCWGCMKACLLGHRCARFMCCPACSARV